MDHEGYFTRAIWAARKTPESHLDCLEAQRGPRWTIWTAREAASHVNTPGGS